MTQRRKKQRSKKKRFAKDPHAEREAGKYGSPIPSREFIMSVLADTGRLMTREELAAAVGIHSEDDIEALRRRLRAMERDGQLLRNRKGGYGLIERMDLVPGRIIGHADGFGFLVPDEGGDDLFLGPRQMSQVFNGDRVVARVTGLDRRGRREGAIVEVLERNTQCVVGRIYFENGISFVVPDHKRLPLDIRIPPDAVGGARHGQFVSAQIVEQPNKRSGPVGKVVEVIGDHMAPGMEIDVAIRAHEVPLEWSAAVQDEIQGLAEKVSPVAKRNRVDLRDLPLVTIDGADSRDFDDAVYCKRTPKGWKLIVAIADVSHYVKAGSALDAEAHVRGNSVYFPERVIPMLPEVLSNGLCSLNPEVDRLCMVCEMTIDRQGKVTRSSFMEAVMCSHARLTYDEVAAMLVEREPKVREQYAPLVDSLEELYSLYKAFRKLRNQRGAIDFETTETRIVFGADRKIERIVPVQRNDAHKIIEECMIAANVCTARFLKRHKLPTLYRVHEGPKAEKLSDLREFLGELGLSLQGGDKPQAGDYAKLLQTVQSRPDAHLIQTVMLRSLSQARYSPENVGHFGLSHSEYLHFTSPIRRYPDLLVHRAIRHHLRNQARKKKSGVAAKLAKFSYTEADMATIGEQCSVTERRADDATRDAVDWLKCEYMLDKVGEDYDGIVTSATSFGLFVELKDIYVEGLVHITALQNDYYHFDPAGHRLRGERTGKQYRLGDEIRIKVARVNLDDRKIDFELPDSGKETPGKQGQNDKPRSKKKRNRKSRNKRRSRRKE
ncbi:3'-to-5' exoribonuclease RNase R [hydrothermal vent metagenome]|uniref:exoribonuclease II n=1 Tax=hydrothermal vent metagenome TaxID=652676 RepID=A0A3B0YBK8_9ZZZZ